MFLNKCIYRTMPVLLLITLGILSTGAWMVTAAQPATNGGKNQSATSPTTSTPQNNKNSAENPAAKKNVVTVKLVDIIQTFDFNDALADEKYVGKRFQVMGTVSSIKRTSRPTGAYVVVLYSLESMNRQYGIGQVPFSCEFALATRKQLAKLKRTQKIIIEGRLERKASPSDRTEQRKGNALPGEPLGNEKIIFRDCRLVTTFPVPKRAPVSPGGPAYPGVGGTPAK